MPTNDSFLQLFGQTLLWHPRSNAHVSPEDVLGDRTVLLYFSASWCMPCVRFTPKLIQTYTNLKERGERVEIVLVSCDQEQNFYNSYARKMPWFAVPFESLELAQRLVTKFEANHGIPHLAVIRPDGTSLEVDDAVGAISADPLGTHFPWPPRPMSEMLPDKFCRYSGGVMEQVPMSTLEGKYLLLYFAADWSAPCQNFAPELEKMYVNLKKHRSDFELLLVSGDRCDDEFHQHLEGLSFGAIPYHDKDCRTGLMRRLKIRSGPGLVMLGPNGEVINDKVRLQGDYISNFPYRPKSYGDLKYSPMEISVHKCVLIFCEEVDHELQEDVVEACQLAAEELKSFSKESLKVYWNLKPNAVSESIRQITELSTDLIQMVLLDLPDSGAYYVATNLDGEMITSQDIVDFCKAPGKRRHLV